VKASPGAPLAATEHDPRWRAVRFLDAMRCAYPDTGPVRLPQSYADQADLPRTAFTYDAAVAALAYLAMSGSGAGEILADAGREVAEGLLRAGTGPLHRAYALEPYRRGVPVPVRLAGYRSGDQAWAGIALCEAYRRCGDPDLLAGACRLGAWVRDTCRSGAPAGGYRDGTAADGTPVMSVSTADNAALVALFDRLAGLTGEQAWLACARHAAGFVRRMWDGAARHMHAGAPGVQAVMEAYTNAAPTVTAQALSWLALGDRRTLASLAWVLRALRVTDTPIRLTGITAAPGATAVWLEGCAQYALALSHAPAGTLPAQAQLCTPIRAQMMLGGGETVAGRSLPEGCGVVAASSPLDVPGRPVRLPPVRHVGATAWFVLAACAVNPLANRYHATAGGAVSPPSTVLADRMIDMPHR
jgi:hypothetical protein